MIGGEKIKIDRDYILNSVWDPGMHIVEGYGPVSKMNSFKGKLTQDDVNEIVAYLKYLNDPESVTNKTEAEVEKEKAAEGNKPEAEKTST